MKSIPRTILAILLTVATFCVAAAQQTNVFYPAFPVLTGRTHNIVSEICIDGRRGSTLDYVEVALDGIDRKAVRNVKLMYTGTTSVIPSRTTSFVISDWVKMYGGGQKLWCHPDFAIEISTTRIKDGKAYLPCGKALVDGPNYMYVSMEIAAEKVDLSMPFKADVQAISVGGKLVDIEKDGNAVRHLGTSVRQAGDDGSDSYRIPGLVTTKKGTLIAVYDVRYDSSQDLQCNIDIGASRSIDAGRTWEKMRVVMDLGEWGGLPQAQNGIGDPAVLVDEETGEIFVIAVWTHGIGGRRAWSGVKQGMTPEETAQLMICSSKDDGKTWSEPVNITSQIKQPEWYMTLQGPGRGITMHDGTLVFPIQYIGTDRIPNAGIIYSKDHGKTWHMHNHAYTNTTEAQVAEVSPGMLMLNMRDNRRTGRRVCTTTDLGKTWTEHPSSGHLVEPVCMASLISVPADDNVFGRDILLFSNPATTEGRHHMTIKASLNGGYTWLEANSLLLDEEGHENWVAVAGLNLPMLVSAYGARMGAQTAADVAKEILPEAKGGIVTKPEGIAPAEAVATAPVARQGAIPEGTVLGDGHIKIAHVRVDTRLLHGQVATTWTKTVSPDRIIVVSDGVAHDQLRKTMIEQAAPPGVPANVVPISKMIEVTKDPRFGATKAMLLFENPQDLLTAIEGGVDIKEANIGSMAHSVGKVVVTNAIAMDNADVETLEALHAKGVALEARKVPSDSPISYEDLIKKAKSELASA